jgi:hypothetical protein
MSRCEDSEDCKFLHNLIMVIMPTSVNLYKQLYCLENSNNCARNMVSQALGSDAVPTDLFPHHKDRAEMILSRSSH